LDTVLLPLQEGLSRGAYAVDDGIGVLFLSVGENPHVVRVRAGIFFNSIIPGCSCADDPTPDDRYAEYCEVQFDIRKATADTSVTLLDR